ncbi:hypothetical protein [Micromonospora auratinigra]|uniref:Uncharacterized protein n=1 Tax=Micromonospora auratinigra TaxID=261654 RepID=A0A1A8Z663_9ACTN|nr:hypothetical protein [Micromonospora auratinigra]SBT39275.1 hypothetical protein GA0070611_0848 [Micromonospora auratinigra]
MRALIWVVAVIAGALILVGLILQAAKWLIIIGGIALIAAIVLAFVRGRRAMQRH